MPYFVKLEIVDSGGESVTRTFSQVGVEVGSFGDIVIDEDDFSGYEFKIQVLPEGLFLRKDWDNAQPRVNGALVPKISPLQVGDVITQGGTSTIKVVDVGEEDEMPATGDRYVRVRILEKCPKCGGGLPMNGLLSEVLCDACHKTTSPSPEYWKSVLGAVLDDLGDGAGSFSLNFSTNVSWKVQAPLCPECSTELLAGDVATGADDDISCSSCGARCSTYRAPGWIRELLPSITQVFCGQREQEANSCDIKVSGSKPVMLACPGCGGSLKVTGDSERTVTCLFCDADVYLPDDLWARLHPQQTAADWFLRLEGPTTKERDEDREAAIAEAREAMAEIERSRTLEEKQKRRAKTTAVVTIAALAAVTAAVIAFSFFSGLLD